MLAECTRPPGPSGQRIHRIDHGLGKTLIQEILQRDGAIFDDIMQEGDELKSRVAKLRQQSQWVKDVGCSLAIGLSLMSLKGDAKCFFKQKTAYEIPLRLVGSEMCIRDRTRTTMISLQGTHGSNGS